MVFLKSVGAGIATSVLFVVAYVIVLGVVYRNVGSEVGINILGPAPLGVALAGFATGFYLVLRNSN